MKSDPKKSKTQRSSTAPGSALPPAAQSLSPVREGAEPAAGDSHVPIWMIFVLGLAFYWGQLYLDQNAGQFHPRVHEPYQGFAQLTALNPEDPEQAFFKQGLAVYSALCLGCHQPTGLGTPNQFPPLVGSEWVLTPEGNRPILIVLHGLTGPIEILGKPWPGGTMPPLGDGLSDEQVAAVVTYIRNAWGNTAPPVSPEQVAELRQQHATRSDYWTGPELLAIPD